MATVTVESKASLEDIAYHEAAHVAVLIVLHRSFDYVDIVPDATRDVLGHVFHKGDEDRSQISREEVLELAFVCRAAPASDDFRGRFDSVGSSHDYSMALGFCQSLPADKVMQAFGEAGARAQEFVRDPHNQERIASIAQALLERKRLTYAEVMTLLENHEPKLSDDSSI